MLVALIMSTVCLIPSVVAALSLRLKTPLFHSLVAIYSFNNWMFEALQEKIEFDFYPEHDRHIGAFYQIMFERF